MSVRVLVPGPLRPFTAERASVELPAGAVRDVLLALTAAHDGLRDHLFREDGRLRSFVNVYVNDEDIRHLQGLETPAAPGDTVSIVPSVAGGAPVAGPAAELDGDEILRYSRHLSLAEVGTAGQKKLKQARVLCVGAGGLGSPAATYLAAAGIGTIGLVDFDVVDVSNLQRQILYSTDQVGQPKIAAAAARIGRLNPFVHVVSHETRLTAANALEIIAGYDVVVDGADNFPTRYLVNDACVLLGKPNAYGSIFRFDGQASVFAVTGGPCYRCLYPEPPPPGLVPSCAEGGVLGVLPGLIGTVQAAEAIKIVLGAGETLSGRLLLADVLAMRFRTLVVRRDTACPICGDQPTITTLVDYEQFCGLAPAANSPAVPAITARELRARLDRRDPVFVLDVREPHEFQICRLAESHLVPLGELERRLDELPDPASGPEIVVHCKAGSRSAKAVAQLQALGFTRLKNLTGGILAWIDLVDPGLRKY